MSRLFNRPATGERIGHYPPITNNADEYTGAYRQVFQRHALPGAGAAEFTYSTFMLMPNNLYGAGQPLDRGVPAGVEAAIGTTNPDYVLVNPSHPINGTFTRGALLPSDLVGQFSGKIPG